MSLVRAYVLLLSITVFIVPKGSAQNMDTGSIFSQPVALDTFTIRSGFDVNAFIRRIKNDTTFYKAFRSMHLVPYAAINDIKVYNNNSNTIAAAEYSRTQQVRTGNCRKTRILEQTTSGKYYKRNGEYAYYTSALFAYLFFTKDSICNEDDIVAGNLKEHGNGRMEKSKFELKQLIFNPGSKVKGIPFMADRASIFEEDEARKYDFSVSRTTHEGEECYLFKITPKKEFKNKVLYNELTTWFRKKDYGIIARNYSISYQTLLYDFDVTMQVRTTRIGNKIYPSYIGYNGNWHIFMKKRERVRFSATMTY
jgi:hypothetical protein